MPLLLGVPPAGAVEAIGDEAVSSTSGNFDPRYAAALAVSIFSVLPVPGMFGFGGGGDVYRDAEKRKNGFGFKSVDDAVNAARGASNAKARQQVAGAVRARQDPMNSRQVFHSELSHAAATRAGCRISAACGSNCPALERVDSATS